LGAFVVAFCTAMLGGCSSPSAVDQVRNDIAAYRKAPSDAAAARVDASLARLDAEIAELRAKSASGAGGAEEADHLEEARGELRKQYLAAKLEAAGGAARSALEAAGRSLGDQLEKAGKNLKDAVGGGEKQDGQ
jgi:hypothetical protein